MTLKDRIRARLKELGKTSWAACRDVFRQTGDKRFARDILRDILRGKQESVRADRVELIAIALDVTEDWVLGLPEGGGRILETASRSEQIQSLEILPVRGKVAAGVWLEMADTAQALGYAPVSSDPDFDGHDQWLEEVDGDSMDKVYPAGTFVHVVDAISIGYAPRAGDHVIVMRRSQQGGLIERSLKTVALNRGRVELWPESTNPAWSRPLSYAQGAKGDDVTVEIVALVIGEYRRVRRR
jgi:transcriptional regulator with XRE-family HTH domain